jgi:predicted HicB family RNase H-like nuclease
VLLYGASSTHGVTQDNVALDGRNYSGEFRVRIPPMLHRNLATTAAEPGVSLNRLARATLAA